MPRFQTHWLSGVVSRTPVKYESGIPAANPKILRILPENPISVGPPGGQIVNNCGLLENTHFAQVLHGNVLTASDGSATTEITGELVNQHPYLAIDNTDIVNVMEFLANRV
jgi:hypothetical protein